MAVEKIANRQLFFILFLARSTLKIAFLPVVTSADALQDAWISAILSFFGGALLVIAIGGLAVRFPNETMVQYSQKLLGKWPGKALSLLPLGAFLFMSSAELRIYAEALTTLFITETPLVFGIGTMGFAAALAVYAGIEPLGRAADLFPHLSVHGLCQPVVCRAPVAAASGQPGPVWPGGRGRCCHPPPVAVICGSWSWRSWSLGQTKQQAPHAHLGMAFTSFLLVLVTVATRPSSDLGGADCFPFPVAGALARIGQFLGRIGCWPVRLGLRPLSMSRIPLRGRALPDRPKLPHPRRADGGDLDYPGSARIQ